MASFHYDACINRDRLVQYIYKSNPEVLKYLLAMGLPVAASCQQTFAFLRLQVFSVWKLAPQTQDKIVAVLSSELHQSRAWLKALEEETAHSAYLRSRVESLSVRLFMYEMHELAQEN